jgi:hypothetical protein
MGNVSKRQQTDQIVENNPRSLQTFHLWGQRQKGPNYVLQKMTKVPLSIKYQSATIIGGAHVQYIYTMYIYI